MKDETDINVVENGKILLLQDRSNENKLRVKSCHGSEGQ